MTFANRFEPVPSRERLSAWRQAARAVVAFCHGLPVQPLSLRPEDDRYFHLRPPQVPPPVTPLPPGEPGVRARLEAEVAFYWAGHVVTNYETITTPPRGGRRERRRSCESDPDLEYGDALYGTLAPVGSKHLARQGRCEMWRRVCREVALDPQRYVLMRAAADAVLKSPERFVGEREVRRLLLRHYYRTPGATRTRPLSGRILCSVTYSRFSRPRPAAQR